MASSPNVGAPPSGSYGEGVALENLKQALPQGAVGGAPPPAPPPAPISPEPVRPTAPQREGRPGTAAAPPPGFPSVLFDPTTQPDVPVNTPLATPPGQMIPAGAANAQQQRLAVLDQLASSPDVSEETREWAKLVSTMLVGGEGQTL